MSVKIDSESPIGVFDSGVGGISVLRELVKIMPNEDYLYFGDSVNAPYGTKEVSVIRELTIKNVEKLMEMGAKSIVVACNTATSAAVRTLRQMYPDMPLVGIEPAIKPAVEYKKNSRVVVMATPMTLKQDKFQKLMEKYDTQAEIVPLPCPGLMEFVERGDLEGDDLYKYLNILFGSVNQSRIDSVVLGCTHYPFAINAIRNVLGDDVKIFDGGEGTAREMRRRLNEAGLLNKRTENGSVRFINSRDTEEERRLCEFLLKLKW
ncbi:glutamate racemase [Eubacterium sp. MSJ-13]|uniref:glutamate racemase n=1 Tax=Eubacterium sp. MSJ-13 TaxID=2841513 RepID=UPI0035300BED